MIKRKLNNLKSLAFNVTQLLEYQENAIVSREIIKRNAGSVTLFAFDKGQGLSEHTAPFDATLFIVDGSASVTVAGKSRPVKTGEMIILPAGKPHAVKAVKRFKMLLIMVRE